MRATSNVYFTDLIYAQLYGNKRISWESVKSIAIYAALRILDPCERTDHINGKYSRTIW